MNNCSIVFLIFFGLNGFSQNFIASNSENKKTWQERTYVSIKAALNRKNVNNWIAISDREKERYEEIKRLLKNAQA